MFYRLNSKGGKLPGKIVVLTHDIAHRCANIVVWIFFVYILMFRPGGDVDAKAELVKFLSMSTEKGYEFKTVDTYLTD